MGGGGGGFCKKIKLARNTRNRLQNTNLQSILQKKMFYPLDLASKSRKDNVLVLRFGCRNLFIFNSEYQIFSGSVGNEDNLKQATFYICAVKEFEATCG